MKEIPDERVLLYEQFKDNVLESSSQDYYDEDDLVEIYDYAGDIDDEFVKMEVLMCGARLYPQSDRLRVRRAYFYYSIQNEQGVAALSKLPHEESPLWDIINLRIAKLSDKEIIDGFNQMLNKNEEFDDETVIQLVDAASALNKYDWLINNIERIKKRCNYEQTLLYETAIVSELNGDYAHAVKMLEELTMIEPFNVVYWVLLAQEYTYMADYEKSLNAVDYALAIDSENQQALLLKAQVIYQSTGKGKEVKNIIKKILAQDPDNSLAIQTLTAILVEENDIDRVEALLHDFIVRHPDDRLVIDYLLTIGAEDADAILDRLFSQEEEHEETLWLSWAQEHAILKRFKAAAQILDCYNRNAGIVIGMRLFMESLYRSQQYEKIVELMDDVNAYGNQPKEVILTYILALLRLGQDEVAKNKIYENIVKHDSCLNNCTDISEILTEKGFVSTLNNILSIINSDENIPLDDVDPYVVY